MQHIATHTWRHDAATMHCNTPCNTLQHTATRYSTLRHTATRYSTLRHTATHTLRHDAATICYNHTYTESRTIYTSHELHTCKLRGNDLQVKNMHVIKWEHIYMNLHPCPFVTNHIYELRTTYMDAVGPCLARQNMHVIKKKHIHANLKPCPHKNRNHVTRMYVNTHISHLCVYHTYIYVYAHTHTHVHTCTYSAWILANVHTQLWHA